jgi:undecaprenyl-diphosphatase
MDLLMDLLDRLKDLDVKLFIYLNGLGTESWDGFWNFVTHRFTWVPIYLLLLYLVYRIAGWKGLVYYLVAITILIYVVDQTTYYWFKAVFQRPRPSRPESGIADIIRITGSPGGKWGFISAHASNTFAIAVFLGYQIKKIFKPAAVLFVLWAVFISYSRIYVGVHYPADLLVGALWGSFVAFLFLYVLKITNLNEKLDLSKFKES